MERWSVVHKNKRYSFYSRGNTTLFITEDLEEKMFICQRDDICYMQECEHEDCKKIGQTKKSLVKNIKEDRKDKNAGGFVVGDLVKYKASFLQSVQMYTNVPKDGIITDITYGMLVKVQWCNSDFPEDINEFNIMHVSEPDYSGI